MADYTDTKPVIGTVFPTEGGESPWVRTEPLITPYQLRRQHLWGIPLISGMKDPVTGRNDRLTDDDLKEYIDEAVGIAEAETGLTIFPLQVIEKHAWDRQLYDSFGYFKCKKRPISSVEKITVNLSSNDDIYEVPLQWVEMGNASEGQLNIIPLTIALTSGNPVAIPTTAGGALLLSIFQGKSQWVAAFWQLLYTAGFPNGEIPKIVNNYIGVIAAMEVLSQLASTRGLVNSASLNIDGMGQSVSTPGPEVFKPRLEDLEKKRAMLVGKLKNIYHLKIFSGNV